MSLTWHIVRKDLRRLWLPLLLWLGLVLAHTGLLLLAGGRAEDPPNPASFQGLRYFADTWGVVISVVGFVLAAWLVMEDSLVAPQAFWPTRPISGARLLVAKVSGALLMFSVGPVLVLAPVWLGCGFSAGQLAGAAGTWAAAQALLSAAAFAIAGVTATSGKFLVRATGAAIVVPICATLNREGVFTADTLRSVGLLDSRSWLVTGLLAVTTGAVIAHQFLTRRTARSWLIAGSGLTLMLAVQFFWFWDYSPLVRSEARRGGMNRPEIRDVTILDQQFERAPSPTGEGEVHLSLRGATAGIPAQSYLRVNASVGEWIVGKERFALRSRLRTPSGPAHAPEMLARRIAGLPAKEEGPGEWSLAGDEPGERVEQCRVESRKLEVAVNLTLLRGRLLGELPLRLGAGLKSGATSTRIIGLERTNAGFVVRLKDRDGQVDRSESVGTGPRRLAEDVFILVHRPTAHEQLATLGEVGVVQINSILVGERELTIKPPTREVNGQAEEIPDWERDAVLLQVRFQPEPDFLRLVTVDPFAPASRR